MSGAPGVVQREEIDRAISGFDAGFFCDRAGKLLPISGAFNSDYHRAVFRDSLHQDHFPILGSTYAFRGDDSQELAQFVLNGMGVGAALPAPTIGELRASSHLPGLGCVGA